MPRRAMRYLERAAAFVILSSLFFSLDPSAALAEILVHDTIAIKGEELTLTAETRGRLFAKGGEVVEFLVEGKSLGKTLSGGDGVAFRQFIPPRTGLIRITVKSAQDEGRALLLVLAKGSRIVFVDVEGGLQEGQFVKKPMQGSQKALKEINRRFPVVFLQTGILGTQAIKAWLKEEGFPDLPVLPWGQGMVFSDLSEKGIPIKAVVGAPAVVESAKEYKPLLFSFGETEVATAVKDWEEIRKRLR